MKTHLHWEQSQFIPPARGKNIQPGLAGAIVGVASNNFIIAGGSNFEDALPWRGGKKLYHDEIYVMHENEQAVYKWITSKTTLPFALAYSGNVTISKGIVCVGGENEKGPLNHVFLLSLEDETPSIKVLPNLPYVVSSPGTTAIESTIYVVGGLDNTSAISSFSAIDLSEQNPKWKRLPDLPVPLSHAVVVAQWHKNEQCIYVIGGRVKKGAITEFLSSVWEYTPSLKSWKLTSQIQTQGHEVLRLSAGTGVALGHNEIIVFGGDKGIIYNQTERMIVQIDSAETDSEKQRLIQDKISLLENHPGFYNEILIYHTDTQSFGSAGTVHGAVQVTTTAVSWNKKVFIPGGEIKPGVRTPEVKVVSIN